MSRMTSWLRGLRGGWHAKAVVVGVMLFAGVANSAARATTLTIDSIVNNSFRTNAGGGTVAGNYLTTPPDGMQR